VYIFLKKKRVAVGYSCQLAFSNILKTAKCNIFEAIVSIEPIGHSSPIGKIDH